MAGVAPVNPRPHMLPFNSLPSMWRQQPTRTSVVRPPAEPALRPVQTVAEDMYGSLPMHVFGLQTPHRGGTSNWVRPSDEEYELAATDAQQGAAGGEEEEKGEVATSTAVVPTRAVATTRSHRLRSILKRGLSSLRDRSGGVDGARREQRTDDASAGDAKAPDVEATRRNEGVVDTAGVHVDVDSGDGMAKSGGDGRETRSVGDLKVAVPPTVRWDASLTQPGKSIRRRRGSWWCCCCCCRGWCWPCSTSPAASDAQGTGRSLQPSVCCRCCARRCPSLLACIRGVFAECALMFRSRRYAWRSKQCVGALAKRLALPPTPLAAPAPFRELLSELEQVASTATRTNVGSQHYMR